MQPPMDDSREAYQSLVGEQEKLMLKARAERKRSVWAGFGFFGIIGWSIVIPTLVGAALGKWLDAHHPQSFSWTLSLLVVGLFMGCFMAGRWISKEHKDMNERK